MGEDTKDWRNNNTMADGAAAAKLWQEVPTRGHSVGKTQKHIREQQANKQARRDGDRKDRERETNHTEQCRQETRDTRRAIFTGLDVEHLKGTSLNY